jgi:branched-chain amino acid transport system permease protein
MSELWHLLLKGLALGCVYAIASMGFATLFKTNRILNFAHGQFMATSALIFILLNSLAGLTVHAAFVLGIMISIALTLIMGWILTTPLNDGSSTRGILTTLGIALMLKGIGTVISEKSVSPGEVNPAGVSTDLIILAGCVTAIFLLFLFLYKSPWGLYVRAISGNRPAFLSLGLPVKRLSVMSLILAGAAAGAAGILLVISSGLGAADLGSMESIIFPVIVLGGIAGFRGAVLGGVVIGLIQTLEQGRPTGSLIDIAPYLFLLLILVIRPYGLLAERGNGQGRRLNERRFF